MGRKSVALGVAGIIAAGSIWAGVGGASAQGDRLNGWPGSASAESVGTLTAQSDASMRGADLLLRGRSTRDAFVDIGMDGDSPGDFVLFNERLLAANSDRVVGRDAVRCENGLRTFTCEATFRIDGKGKIRIAGAVFSGRDNVIPVTGGTGRYKGVGGSFRFFGLGGGDTLFVFDLTH